MSAAADLPTEAEVVADLVRIRRLDWSKPESFTGLRALYDLLPGTRPARTDAAAIRDALHALLGDLIVELENQERLDPPELDRSLGHAGRHLLKLNISVGTPVVDELYDAIVTKWKKLDRRTGKTAPLGAGTFKTNHKARVYRELAFRLLSAATEAAGGPQTRGDQREEAAAASQPAEREGGAEPRAGVSSGADYAAATVAVARLSESAQERFDAGDYEAALPMFRRVVALREEQAGPEDPMTMSSIHSTIYTLVELQRFSEALPLCERLVAVCDRTLGRDDRRTRDARAWLEHVARSTS